ncbi:MAG: arginine repressor [Gemmatimonadetes bacterium]|nr:arginine repressor [Gemmatimonadota bacterium]
MRKRERQQAILELIRRERITSQERLRARLEGRGVRVTQATLSRDLRELGLVKLPGASGGGRYASAGGDEGAASPPLERLLPDLFASAGASGNLVLVRTVAGSAQPVAAALDRAAWPEVLGTVAGDDTVLVVLRRARQAKAVLGRLATIASGIRTGARLRSRGE